VITLGLDIGSVSTKAVVVDDDRVRATRIQPTTGTVDADVEALIGQLQREVGRDEFAGIVATGVGQQNVSAAHHCEDTAVCIGWAVRELLAGVELAVDVGGQSITTLSLDVDGEVSDLRRNDKCASGTGRFLEVMAAAVGVPLDDLDRVAASAAQSVSFGTQCGVFVESEVVTAVNDGRAPADIAAGLCDAVAQMVASQARRLGEGRPYTLTGGVARLQSVVDRVTAQVAGPYHPLPLDPSLAAAAGAALLAFPE